MNLSHKRKQNRIDRLKEIYKQLTTIEQKVFFFRGQVCSISFRALFNTIDFFYIHAEPFLSGKKFDHHFEQLISHIDFFSIDSEQDKEEIRENFRQIYFQLEEVLKKEILTAFHANLTNINDLSKKEIREMLKKIIPLIGNLERQRFEPKYTFTQHYLWVLEKLNNNTPMSPIEYSVFVAVFNENFVPKMIEDYKILKTNLNDLLILAEDEKETDKNGIERVNEPIQKLQYGKHYLDLKNPLLPVNIYEYYMKYNEFIFMTDENVRTIPVLRLVDNTNTMNIKNEPHLADTYSLAVRSYAEGFLQGIKADFIPRIDTPENRKELILKAIFNLHINSGFPITYSRDNDKGFYKRESCYEKGVLSGENYKAWLLLLETPKYFQADFPAFQNEIKKENEIEENELTLAQIALLHIYKGVNILDPRTDPERKANIIAQNYGFEKPTSGEQLYKKFREFDGGSSQRTGVGNIKLMKKNIERILPFLKDESKGLQKAKAELESIIESSKKKN